MSGQLRALKNRIRSVESTQKITRAMEMVATAKLKRYQDSLSRSLPYERTLTGILEKLSRTGRPLHHPLFESRPEERTALLVFTSDTGLCGAYNQDLVATAKSFIQERSKKPLLIGIGKHGIHALTRAGHDWHAAFKDTKPSQGEAVIQEVTARTQDLFSGKTIDALYAVHSRFETKTVARPHVEKILPFTFLPNARVGAGTDDYIFEPGPENLFVRLVPLVLESRIRVISLESLVAEQMARMNAMHQATENASELIETLVLLRNKVRQAAITKELIEIVSGSKALKN
ncbi:MAG: ATP synthase F1 subunit gamma [Candidatus Omnitrophica bacterium]|nr:ATP synthase F1 subunit gamma [Candidatus Omnitrophota bacterium]